MWQIMVLGALLVLLSKQSEAKQKSMARAESLITTPSDTLEKRAPKAFLESLAKKRRMLVARCTSENVD
jgi:hypothetical protein